MLQTPTPPRKYRPLRGRHPGLGYFTGKVGQYGSHMNSAATYTGNPSFMQYRLGPGSDLPQASLFNADLRWHNFRGADLSDVQLSGSILWGAILTNANLRGADLTNADFTGADIMGADLTGAKTQGTCFVGARYSPETRFPKGFGDPEKKGMLSLRESVQIG